MRSCCRTALQNQARPPPHNMYYKLAICIETLRGPEATEGTYSLGTEVYSGVFLAPYWGWWDEKQRRGPVTVENYVRGVRAVSLMPPSLFPDSLRGPARFHQNANLPFKNPPPRAPSQWTFREEKRQNARATWPHRCGASQGARCHSSPMCVQPQLLTRRAPSEQVPLCSEALRFKCASHFSIDCSGHFC